MDDGLSFIPWQVPDHLRPYVQRVTGFRDTQVGVVRRELLIVGCPLMFAFGAPFRLSERRDPARPATVHGSFIAGLHDSYTMSENLGVTEGLHVDLTPLGARQLLGIPMHELTNTIGAVADVLGAEGRALEERLGNLASWEARFYHLEAFLTARLLGESWVSLEMRWAWQQLTMSHGAVPVAILAGELGWSRKRLGEAFRRELGFPPKLIGRMLRYRRAVDFALAAPGRPWAEVAAMSGFHDQAHLHRDVCAFAGLTPEMLRRELAGTFVQDGPASDR